MPYLPFPETWPVFAPKDKLGDWFESYAKLLDLDVWTETTITNSSWDEGSNKWTLTINRFGIGQTLILHPKHIIQATGASGEPHIPSEEIPGISTFKGK